MNPSIEIACVGHIADLLKQAADAPAAQTPGPVEPNYNQTLRNIAKRKAIVTAKEIGALTLPMVAGVGAGLGYEKYMKTRGGAGPGARRLMAFGAIPAVGLTAAAAYRAAKDLKEHEFGKIRAEEMGKYDQATREYQASLQRKPQPEGLS